VRLWVTRCPFLRARDDGAGAISYAL
jgi:hypothetical protein